MNHSVSQMNEINKAVNAEKLVAVLFLAFKNEISEENYFDIIACIRKLNNFMDVEDLKPYYEKYNFPQTWNPFKLIDKLRFAFMFGKQNKIIKDLCTDILQIT